MSRHIGLVLSNMCLWFYPDCKSGKCVQVYEPAKGTKLKGFFSCVSCMALDASESWLVSIYVMGMSLRCTLLKLLAAMIY